MEKVERIQCDLAEYKITLEFPGSKAPLVVHFDTPSRRFYFAIIALIITEMKKQGKPSFVHMPRHKDILRLLDKSLSGKKASEHIEGMWAKINMAWRNRLPDLEAAALFKILDRELVSPYEKGGKYRYQCSEEECDVWAGLFGYDENNKWRFKFAFDSASIGLDDISVTLGNLRDNSAWEEFVNRLMNMSGNDQLLIEPKDTGFTEVSPKDRSSGQRFRRLLWGFVVIVVTVIIVAIGWRLLSYETRKPANSVDLSLSVYPPIEKPSLAVLPFQNLTGDSQQEYLSEGVADQLLTSLSQGPYLYVTARTSSFAFKGKPMQAQEIATKLGVQYLIEGSVQHNKDRVRINVQLIDGRDGNHIWSETYDRNFSDLFALQDKIAMDVMAFLNVQITGYATGAMKYSRPNNLKAYEHYLRGLYFHLGRRPEDVQKARQSFEEAIQIDPKFGRAYTWLANTYLDEIDLRLTTQRERVIEKAEQAIQMALTADPDYPPYSTISRIARIKKDVETAIIYGRKGVQQAPNDSGRHYMLCLALERGEKFEEAVESCETALRLVPFRPVNYVTELAWSLVGNAQYDKSIPLFKEVIDRSPQSFYAYLAYKGLTAAYELSDRQAEAHWAAQNVLRMNPNFSLEKESRLSPAKEGPFKERMLNAYRSAGLK